MTQPDSIVSMYDTPQSVHSNVVVWELRGILVWAQSWLHSIQLTIVLPAAAVTVLLGIPC